MPKNIKITDKTKQFLDKHEQAQDRALQQMGLQVIRLSTQRVPVDKGQLKSSKDGSPYKVGRLEYSVIYNSKYAAFQEFGGDSKRTVSSYTTPGTGKHYLTDAGRTVSKQSSQYLSRAAKEIKL